MPAVVIFWGSGLPVGGAGVNLRRPPRSGSNRLDSFLCVAASSKASGLPLTRRPYLPFTLFNKILRCDYHILQSCLSDRLKVLCNLRKRHHNKTSNHDTGDLNDRNFLVRNLYEKTYELQLLLNHACIFVFYALRCYVLYFSYFQPIPQTFTVTSSIGCFLLLSFSVLQFLVVVSVR